MTGRKHMASAEYQRRWKEKNPTKQKAYTRKYYLKNRDKLLEDKKKYRLNNKVKMRHIWKTYIETNPIARLKHRLRQNLINAMNAYRSGKIWSSTKYGIDYTKIINKLGPPPNNSQKWHVDHIRPLKSFDLTNPEEIKNAFAPENLQWLTAEENMRKHTTWNGD